MTSKFAAVNRLALLAAGAVIAASLVSAASAESMTYDKRGRVTYGPGGPNVVVQQGRTRLYISKRSWLDAGTEVLPGDRKFQDYAFPSEYGLPTFARSNGNRTIDRHPMNPPSDMGGYPSGYPIPEEFYPSHY
jgi:hypothetical protein